MMKTLLALAALLASSSTMAQVYVGAAGGLTNQDVSCSGWSSCDKSDTGLKLYAGYRFTPIVAGEVAYTNFGDVSLGAPGVSGNYSGTAFSVGAAFFLPFAPKFTGIGRLGLAATDADYGYSSNFVTVGGSTNESSIEPYFGLGLAYALTPQLSLTGSFDYMQFDYPRGSGAATLLAIGVSYAF